MTVRRMKTYAGGQGYVYQYYFVGKRPALSGEPPAAEFIFDVTSDRKVTFAVSVFLSEQLLRSWAAEHGRKLNDAEQYGAVKIRLFQAFDDLCNMMADGRRLEMNKESLDTALTTLGVE